MSIDAKPTVGGDDEGFGSRFRADCEENESMMRSIFFFFFTLVTGPGRSLSLTLSDTRVCEP